MRRAVRHSRHFRVVVRLCAPSTVRRSCGRVSPTLLGRPSASRTITRCSSAARSIGTSTRTRSSTTAAHRRAAACGRRSPRSPPTCPTPQRQTFQPAPTAPRRPPPPPHAVSLTAACSGARRAACCATRACSSARRPSSTQSACSARSFLLIHSFIRSFIHSFTCSCIHALISFFLYLFFSLLVSFVKTGQRVLGEVVVDRAGRAVEKRVWRRRGISPAPRRVGRPQSLPHHD